MRTSDLMDFRIAWKAVEAEGGCDAYHSMECLRVRAEWLAASKPRPIADFIREAANRPPLS